MSIYYDIYKEWLSSNEKFKNTIVEKHIDKYKEIDKIYPSNQSFFLIINTYNLRYEFVSKNFETITGYKSSDLLKKGPDFLLSHLHPDDLNIWLNEIKDLIDLTMTDFDLEERKKLLYTYNFRFKNKMSNYLNIVAHLTPIEFNSNGKPILAISHYTIVGENNNHSMTASIKKLNEKNVYETVFYKNYSKENLTTVLTEREIDIVQELALEKSSKEIASRLCISSHTVDQHRRNILKKLKFRSTGELIQYCKTNNYF